MDSETFKKLFEAQRKLDDAIIRVRKVSSHELRDKLYLSLFTEIAEMANNWRGFKYWSKDQEPRLKDPDCAKCDENGLIWSYNSDLGIKEPLDQCDCRNPLLEEFVDCIHFLLSIGNFRRLESGY